MNILKAENVKGSSLPPLPRMFEGKDIPADCLRDESRLEGAADCAAFPSTTEEVAALMIWANEKGLDVTVSGGRTGIAGGAVPNGGMLLSLTKLQKIYKANESDDANSASLVCQSGALLSDLRSYLVRNKSKFMFPPDPTETSANIGGMIACNASGAHTYRYGPTRNYVKALTVVLANGDILKIRRGQTFAYEEDNSFDIVFADGSKANCKAPDYLQPKTKNAAGYYSGKGMDLIDLFIGSEGTLGVIVEAELSLEPKPEFEFNAMFFISCESAAVELTEKLRERSDLEITAIEYFGPGALDLLRKRRETLGAASAVPPGMPESKDVAGIYIDVSTSSDKASEAVKKLKDIADSINSGKALTIWSAFDTDERERLRKFRHALPETVNSIIAERRKAYPSITKLGTDMAVPDGHLTDILKIYRKKLDAKSLQYVVFGHIGNNHVHVNILPDKPEEYLTGKQLYIEFAERVLEMRGSISAEHGIGKLKKDFLSMMLGDSGIKEMRAVKNAFDPKGILGKGTLF